MNYKQMNPKEYAVLKSKKLKRYTDKIDNPSKDFMQFLYEYFTGSPMIRGRVEEDVTVWERLKDEELEISKQMILDNLGYDFAYMRAIDTFRDERGITLLEKIAETPTKDRFGYERLYAAKVLYDWIGYAPYLELLKSLLPKGGSYTKTSLDMWIYGIDKTLATHYIFLMLRDKDSFVRWCAYGTFKRYFNFGDDMLSCDLEEQKKRYEENKYYTDESVYFDKELFEIRLKELEIKIHNRR